MPSVPQVKYPHASVFFDKDACRGRELGRCGACSSLGKPSPYSRWSRRPLDTQTAQEAHNASVLMVHDLAMRGACSTRRMTLR